MAFPFPSKDPKDKGPKDSKDPFADTPMRAGNGIGDSEGGALDFGEAEDTSEEPKEYLMDLLKQVADGSLSPEDAEPKVRDACGGM